jgi:quercetin dioxygenase-like cupin family protein
MAHEERQAPTPVLQTADVPIVEYDLRAGEVHPWHYHSEVSDMFHCLEGLIVAETREAATEAILRSAIDTASRPRWFIT